MRSTLVTLLASVEFLPNEPASSWPMDVTGVFARRLTLEAVEVEEVGELVPRLVRSGRGGVLLIARCLNSGMIVGVCSTLFASARS